MVCLAVQVYVEEEEVEERCQVPRVVRLQVPLLAHLQAFAEKFQLRPLVKMAGMEVRHHCHPTMCSRLFSSQHCLGEIPELVQVLEMPSFCPSEVSPKMSLPVQGLPL